MREISPAVGLSADAYLEMLPEPLRQIIEGIRRQKQAGTRPHPSATLIDRGSYFDAEFRANLLDVVASLVDENLSGRSDMCIQFADLLARGLRHLNLPARAVGGEATYFSPDGDEIFSWPHAWVRVGSDVIDGNVDSLAENIMVPEEVRVHPYWGPITAVPADRYLKKQPGQVVEDEDVANTWWPDLRARLDRGL